MRKPRKRQQVVPGVVQMCCRVGEPGLDRLDHPTELFAHRGGVGLVEDGAHHGGHPRLCGLGHPGQQVAQVVGAAGAVALMAGKIDEVTRGPVGCKLG